MDQVSSDHVAVGSAADWIELADVRHGQMTVKLLSSGKKAVLFRNGEDISVFHEICPHMGADLSEAVYCTRTKALSCRWHGYVFSSLDGTFVDNPNERLTPLLRQPSKHFRPEKTPSYRLRNIPFTIKGTRLYFGRDEET